MGLILFVTTVLLGQRPPPHSLSHPLGRTAFISSFHDFDLFYYHNQNRHYYYCNYYYYYYYHHHHHFGKIPFSLAVPWCGSMKKQEERSFYFHEEKNQFVFQESG